jgi:hypothetical protein
LRGGILKYVAQASPQVDAARAKKDHFRMETNLEISLAEAAHKPGSVPAAGYPSAGDDHSSSAIVADGVERPTRRHGRAALGASLLGLAPGGVFRASDVTAEPGELLPHPFTLTSLRQGFGGRSPLCGTFPGVTPAGRYPAPCPAEPGLSSPRLCRGFGGQRSSGLLRPSTAIITPGLACPHLPGAEKAASGNGGTAQDCPL